MRAEVKHPDEQFRLIMECRSSGLTDHEWCRQHDINPSTFHGWVKRLRKKGYTGIPTPVARNNVAIKQEVVRIDAASLAENYDPDPVPSNLLPALLKSNQISTEPVMEIMIGGDVIRIPNGMSPMLIDQTIRLMKELSC